MIASRYTYICNRMSEQISKPLIEADPDKGVKVNAGVVAKAFRDEIKHKVERMKQEGLGKLERRGEYRRLTRITTTFKISETRLATMAKSPVLTHTLSSLPSCRTASPCWSVGQQRPCCSKIRRVDWQGLSCRWITIRIENSG